MKASNDLALTREITKAGWTRHGLARQFLLVAAAALLIAMFVLGKWVAQKVENGVAEFAGASAAVYINTFLAPHLQELAYRDTLSKGSIDALNGAMGKAAVRTHVTGVKVWKQDGLIIYSDKVSLIGKRFEPSAQLRRASNGAVSTKVAVRHHEDDTANWEPALLQLAVYTPIHDVNTGEVLAVLEFYENAEELRAQLSLAETQSWGVTGLVALAMLAALFTIVSQGGKAIDHLRSSLSHRIEQLRELLRQNEALRARAERVSRNVAEGNERFMPRMAADLREGPAQSITCALLHLNALERSGAGGGDMALIRGTLLKALADIWNVSASLTVPEVQGLSLKDALLSVVQDHERRTRRMVARNLSDHIPESTPEFIKICAVRFIQVCLDGVDQHCGAQDLRVCAEYDGTAVTLEMTGKHHDSRVKATERSIQLGLAGLWDQIESIGGTITVMNEPAGALCLIARLPLAPER
jgi:signal transduction histidine kinase